MYVPGYKSINNLNKIYVDIFRRYFILMFLVKKKEKKKQKTQSDTFYSENSH